MGPDGQFEYSETMTRLGMTWKVGNIVVSRQIQKIYAIIWYAKAEKGDHFDASVTRSRENVTTRVALHGLTFAFELLLVPSLTCRL
jgi:hypothetical protein